MNKTPAQLAVRAKASHFDLLALVQSNSLPLTMNASDTSVIAR
jgi:hypothetical protein